MQRYFALIMTAWFAACALGALALDGHKFIAINSARTVTVTSLTTSLSSDIIAAYVGTRSASLVTVTSISAAGTTGWTLRKSLPNAANGFELWYGTATSPLAAVNVTITLSGTPTSALVNVFGISGGNTSIITDPNASLPTSRVVPGTPIPSVTGLSTTFANDMIHTGTVCASAALQTASGAGFTLINSFLNSAGTSVFGSEYVVVGVTQAATTVTFGTACSAGAAQIIADAVEQAAAAAKKSMTLPLLGVGN